jgi:lipopolysaccharide/colanic/teichoic acid biosynthesis glycosyltransferase
MHEDSHDDPYTRENDTRIYPWGDFMRKTRIDELPQLINILKGDMHLLGPRAEWNRLVRQYETQIPYYYKRHIIKPGITGWAQVNYPYGANIYDTKQKLMFDFYYIKHWSLWLEITSLWKTVMVVLGRKGV